MLSFIAWSTTVRLCFVQSSVEENHKCLKSAKWSKCFQSWSKMWRTDQAFLGTVKDMGEDPKRIHLFKDS